MDFKYELAGIHLISSQVDNGRISQIVSSDNYSSHFKLLQLYYSIYGRVNTLNERFVEVLKRKLDTNFATFKFNFVDNDISFNCTEDFYFEINIPNLLGQILFPSAKFPTFYECHPKDINWSSIARAKGVLEMLNDCIERGYYYIIRNYDFQKIKNLLVFIDLQKDFDNWKSIDDYNFSSKNSLIELLKIFQSAFIYQKFANKSICTTLMKDNGNILGLTVGGDLNGNDDFINVIRNNTEGVLKIIDNRLFKYSSNAIKWKLEDLEFRDIPKVKEIFCTNDDAKNILGLTSKICKELRELQNQVHEGHPLSYIIETDNDN